jgi:citrate synthase
MGAAEAARVLGVSRATLYAYVSRGFVRSQSMPGSSRERGYSREDVERLRRRTEERRDPDKAAARALQWGMPVLESSITLIDGEKLYYRGQDTVTLARSRSLAEVATLIWTGRFDTTFAASPLAAPARERRTSAKSREYRPNEGLPFVARAQSTLAGASARDPLAFDVRPESVARCGWRILQLLTRSATAPEAGSAVGAATGSGARSASGSAAGFTSGVPVGAAAGSAASARSASEADAPTIDQALAHAWGVTGRGVDLLRGALILCADHELNVSSFTARCVASAGSNPYAVVMAGLAALEGTRHGGASARVESMLASMRRTRDLRGAVAARLRRGEPIDGFGHPLYPRGDPRATMLIGQLRDIYARSRSAELAFVLKFAKAVTSAAGEKPNIDFALAALSRVLRLPSGSPFAIFAIGRTIGWIGHAIEQYATGQLIRPRAKYVGVVPIAP